MSKFTCSFSIPFGWEKSRAATIGPCELPTKLEYLSDLNIAVPTSLINAVPKRKIEFLLGRYCATQALNQLSAPIAINSAINIAPDRRPLWPPGVVGAITHTDSLVMATVAYAEHYRGIGIDCERILTRLQYSQVARQVSSREELDALLNKGIDDLTALTLIFSAKESLFKCVYPLCAVFFDFLDATLVSIDVKTGKAILSLNRTLSDDFSKGQLFEVNFTLSETFVLTGVSLRT
jgi:enterobactin synthetase component D